MRYVFLSAAMFLLTAQTFMRADDLVLPDGRKFADFQVKKVLPDGIWIAYRNARGEPDAAEIPFRELPENVRRLYPGGSDAAAPGAAPPAPATPAAAPVPAPRRRTGPPPAPGSNEALIDAVGAIGDHFVRQVAALAPGDREGRVMLAAQTRSRVEKSLRGFVREMDCEFVAAWENGIIIKIIGTPAGSPLRCGELLFIAGAERPEQRLFRGRFYPSAERIRCGRYGILPYYGAALHTAADAVLAEIAGLAGEPLFFEPAENAGSAVPEAAAPAAPSTPVQVNNIIVENPSRYWDWRLRPVVIHPGGRPHHKPVPPRPHPAPPRPQPAPPQPQPVPSPPLRQTGKQHDYGILPSWAQPGKTGPSPRGR